LKKNFKRPKVPTRRGVGAKKQRGDPSRWENDVSSAFCKSDGLQKREKEEGETINDKMEKRLNENDRRKKQGVFSFAAQTPREKGERGKTSSP